MKTNEYHLNIFDKLNEKIASYIFPHTTEGLEAAFQKAQEMYHIFNLEIYSTKDDEIIWINGWQAVKFC